MQLEVASRVIRSYEGAMEPDAFIRGVVVYCNSVRAYQQTYGGLPQAQTFLEFLDRSLCLD
jgi:hypothetical protein